MSIIIPLYRDKTVIVVGSDTNRKTNAFVYLDVVNMIHINNQHVNHNHKGYELYTAIFPSHSSQVLKVDTHIDTLKQQEVAACS